MPSSFPNKDSCRIENVNQRKDLIQVAHVVDGDSLLLKDGRKVRLIGVNTPEMDSRGTLKDLAVKARKATSRFIGNGAFIKAGRQEKDKYQRTLGYVFNLKGESLSAHLLERGLGWHVAIPPNLALSSCLEDYEESAKALKLGVWSLPAKEADAIIDGGFYHLSGLVTNIKFAKNWWLSLDGHVAVLIRPEDQDYFDRDFIQQLEGKKIGITGWVYKSRSSKYEPWRINLYRADALE